MGRLKFILVGFLILIISSCNDLFNVNNIGKLIKFSTLPSTRTIYSPEYDGRIEWVDGDKVAIYMTWEGSQVFENADYSINLDNNDGKLSYGKLNPIGESLKWHGYFKDGRAWEYVHTFYSAYPPTVLNDGKFSFYLPSEQDQMNVSKAPLAAYSTSSNRFDNDGGTVYLEYYPMFTTLHIIIDGEVNSQINALELLSNDYMIAGNYTVDASKRYNGIEGGNINKVSSTFDGNEIIFFIIPREYEANKLYFSLNGKQKFIPEVLHAGYKYNIKITTEVEVEPGFSSFVNGVVLAEAHKQGKNWQWGYVDGERKIFWNNPDNYNNWEPVPDELLWEIINSIVDIDYEGSWEITEITSKDLNIFPKLKTVKINASNLMSIDINNPNITELNITSEAIHTIKVEGCDLLKTFNISSKNNISEVVVKNNKILEYFTMHGPTSNGVNIRCENCPVLEWFSLTGGEAWGGEGYGFPWHKDIINCPNFNNSKVNVPGGMEN